LAAMRERFIAPQRVPHTVSAVVALTAILATSCASPGASVGDAGSPTPSAVSSPTATGPTNLVEAPAVGDLPAGDYYLDLPAYPARIDFAVPAGWWHFWSGSTRETSDANAILVNSEDTGAANGSAWGLAFTIAGDVRVDPCDPAAGSMDSSVTESAEALAEAFSSWPAIQATGAEDVTVGGFAGTSVEITGEEGVCDEPVLFTTPLGYEFGPIFSSSEPSANQFMFVDVEGSVLIIWMNDFPGTTTFEVEGGASPDPQAHVADQDQLHDIFESVVIQPR
jgi:hypothetical protein